jgi:2-polyprenyl-3-methyl-5-hydroxy-6-metoxy-1,4-benzoquinol methylase
MNWDSVETRTNEDLPKNSWALGYFLSPYKGWDGKTWTRNFHELRARDIALFSLGDVNGKRVLEIGCGDGIYMDIIARMGGVVSGQDISPEHVKNAREYLTGYNFKSEIKVGDAVKLLFDNDYFDAVFSADFFEHITLEQKKKVIAEAYRVLKPGGVMVIKTPNLDYLKISILIKRLCAALKLKSPFNLHIEHTRNNPDSQHCGLTSYLELEEILFDNMFHAPEILYVPLERDGLPKSVQKFLYGKKFFTDAIIIKTRKPLFYGFLR